MKTMIAVLLLLAASTADAQGIYYDTIPGYIVTLQQDTVKGWFQFTVKGRSYNSEDWFKKVFFMDSTGTKQKKEAPDILAYGFRLDSMRAYIFRSRNIVVPNKAGLFKSEGVRFVMAEVDGAITLYRYYHEEVSFGFYGWYNERYLETKGSSMFLLKRNNQTQKYKLQDASEWFSGFPEAVNYLEKELDARDLASLVLAFNAWKKQQQ